MTRTTQAKVLILSVFVLGMLTGGVLTEIYETRVQGDDSRAARSRESVHEPFEDYLGLTQDQRTQLHAILERTEMKFDALRSQTKPMYRALREESRAEIRAMLTPEQQGRYDQWRADIEARRGNRRR